MELLESIGWIVVGFVPTFLSLEISYILGARRRGSSHILGQKPTTITSQAE